MNQWADPDQRKPAPGDVWRHKKGNSYLVLTLVFDADDGETVEVVYQSLVDGRRWRRPLHEWMDPGRFTFISAGVDPLKNLILPA